MPPPPNIPNAPAIPAEKPPNSPDELHTWIVKNLKVTIARTPLLNGNSAPFDYICHAFFEGAHPARPAAHPPASAPNAESRSPNAVPPSASPDCTVWANRGGGKTFLGALATLLDLIFKPGIQIRILGGSLDQSQRMFEHLRAFFALESVCDLVDGEPTARRIRLTNGSRAEVLSASQTSVRGTRVQKLRCDEVDLFDPEVWSAAQLTTRSMKCDGPWGPIVRGSVEALSTMHRPYGLMWNLVLGRDRSSHDFSSLSSPSHPATPSPRHLFRWGLLDILEPCGDEYVCVTCSLEPECEGRAKQLRPGGSAGHISISDAVVMKSRVGKATWDAEMLCDRPRSTDSVYPEFDPEVHVYDDAPISELHSRGGRLSVAGMDFGYRDDTVVLLASLDADNVVRIEREHAAPEMTLEEHISVIQGWIDSGYAPGGISWIGVDPAGRQVNGHSGKSSVKLLGEAGFRCRWKAGKIEEGIRAIRARLHPAPWKPALKTVPITIEREPRVADASPDFPDPNGPRLFIHARCVKLIEAIQRYHYPPGRLDVLEPVKDGPDHACDALRYLILNVDRPHRMEARPY